MTVFAVYWRDRHGIEDWRRDSPKRARSLDFDVMLELEPNRSINLEAAIALGLVTKAEAIAARQTDFSQ